MKTKEELQAIAEDVFKRYPDKDKVFVAADGQAFFEEHAAKNHGLKNRTRKEIEITTFLRKVDKPDVFKKNAKEVTDEILAATTIDAVQAIWDTEKEGENRKTVTEAAEKRIAELQKTVLQ